VEDEAMSSRRVLGGTAAAVAAAALAVVLGAQPALALGWNAGAFKGRVGQFAGPDGAEVVCRYDSAGRLRSVTVRPMTVWGSYKRETWVGWRYQLREATEFEAGRPIFLSRVRKDLASRSVASEFTAHRFYVQENLTGERAYYVRPVLFWYAKGSSTTVEGRAKLLYDRYLLKRGTESRWSNACTFDYDKTWGVEP
jgi:hypothetical protein